MKRRNIIAVVILQFFVVATASAQVYDQCTAILAGGVFNTKTYFGDYRAMSDFNEFMCSSAYNVQKKDIDKRICDDRATQSTTSWGSALNIIEFVTGSSNLDLHRSFRQKYCSADKTFNYSAWSAEHCQQTNVFKSSSSITHTFTKNADEKIINAWKDCVIQNKKETDLICYGKEIGNKISFNVIWNHDYADTLKVDKFTISNLNITGEAPNEIKRGEDLFTLQRVNSKDSSLIQLVAIETIRGQERKVSCEYDIPPLPCQNPIFKKGRSEKCGVEKNLSGSGAVCGVLRYNKGRDEACGPELFKLKASAACGVDVKQIHQGNGGCSACGGVCSAMGGSPTGCSEGSHHSCSMPCAIPRTCRHISHGVELFKECELEKFGPKEFKTCEHPSFGIIYKECQLPEFGIERCDDK
jgi:hypothetical protein